MQSWQERVYDEHNELRKKVNKLADFLTSADFVVLQLEDQELLKKQEGVMRGYLEILQQRIDRF